MCHYLSRCKGIPFLLSGLVIREPNRTEVESRRVYKSPSHQLDLETPEQLSTMMGRHGAWSQTYAFIISLLVRKLVSRGMVTRSTSFDDDVERSGSETAKLVAQVQPPTVCLAWFVRTTNVAIPGKLTKSVGAEVYNDLLFRPQSPSNN